jgi:hypothetical protein
MYYAEKMRSANSFFNLNYKNKVLLILSISACLSLSLFTVSVLPLVYGQDQREILIASWNLKNFGESRAESDVNLSVVAEIMNGSNYPNNPGKEYDLIFVQELQSDEDGAFVKLCEKYLNATYDCEKTSTITETGANYEAYGVIYKKDIEVIVTDTNDPNSTRIIPQGQDYDNGEMVRPPMEAKVTINDFEFFVYNNHIKPSVAGEPNFATPKEIENLEEWINRFHEISDVNIIVLGDLNADGHEPWASPEHADGTSCGTKYMYGGFENHPLLFSKPDWIQVFTINNYTNFAANPCSYDKIIPNKNMHEFFIENDIIGEFPESLVIENPPDDNLFGSPYKVDGKFISDHRIVWAKFSIPLNTEISSDGEEDNNDSFALRLLEYLNKWRSEGSISEDEYRTIVKYLVRYGIISE